MPRPRLDLTSRRFGRLVAQYDAGSTAGGKTLWRCICDCGTSHDVAVNVLTSGRARSCGCYLKETASKTGKATWRHNHMHIREPRTQPSKSGDIPLVQSPWSQCIIAGCEKLARTRSGKLCDTHYRRAYRTGSTQLPGRDPLQASVSAELVSERARELVPKRPRHSSHLLSFKGVTLGLSEWAKLTELPKSSLQWRLRKGWPVERALTEPVSARGPLRGTKRIRFAPH